MDFLVTKLRELGWPDPKVDEQGGISLVVPGRAGGEGAVLVFADAGFPPDAGPDCIVSLRTGRAEGRGLAEDSVGVAALLVLAEHLADAGNRPARDLLLHFLPCGAGEEGDDRARPLEDLVRGCGVTLTAAVHLRSVTLGRIEERPVGACRLRAQVRTPGSGPPAAGTSAITILAAIASRLGSIRWDSEGRTFLNVARLSAGAGFGWHASEGILELEIVSADAPSLEVARTAVTSTLQAAAADAGASVDVRTVSMYPPGSAGRNAGLADAVRRVYAKLRIRPVPVSFPDHSATVSALGIPAVSLGITTGGKTLAEEWIDIAPVETGFRQVLALLEEAAGGGTGEVP